MSTVRIYHVFFPTELKVLKTHEQTQKGLNTLLGAWFWTLHSAGLQIYYADVPNKRLLSLRDDLVTNVGRAITNWLPLEEDDPLYLTWKRENLEDQMCGRRTVEASEDQGWALFEVE